MKNYLKFMKKFKFDQKYKNSLQSWYCNLFLGNTLKARVF